MKKELFGLSLIELQELLVAAGLKKFRAAQVYQWLYQKSVTAFDQMRNLSKADIAILEANFTLLPQQLKILREQVSQDDLTRKVLLEFPDGNSVETVLMRHDYVVTASAYPARSAAIWGVLSVPAASAAAFVI